MRGFFPILVLSHIRLEMLKYVPLLSIFVIVFSISIRFFLFINQFVQFFLFLFCIFLFLVLLYMHNWVCSCVCSIFLASGGGDVFCVFYFCNFLFSTFHIPVSTEGVLMCS